MNQAFFAAKNRRWRSPLLTAAKPSDQVLERLELLLLGDGFEKSSGLLNHGILNFPLRWDPFSVIFVQYSQLNLGTINFLPGWDPCSTEQLSTVVQSSHYKFPSMWDPITPGRRLFSREGEEWLKIKIPQKMALGEGILFAPLGKG